MHPAASSIRILLLGLAWAAGVATAQAAGDGVEAAAPRHPAASTAASMDRAASR